VAPIAFAQVRQAFYEVGTLDVLAAGLFLKDAIQWQTVKLAGCVLQQSGYPNVPNLLRHDSFPA
jgi:hypothetical protein